MTESCGLFSLMPMPFIFKENKVVYYMDDTPTKATKGLKIIRNQLVSL